MIKKGIKVEKYVLYGAGHDGIVAMNYLGRDQILCFFDALKCGSTIEGIPVLDPIEIEDKAKEGTVVITVSKVEYVIQIVKQLMTKGVDFVFWKDVVKEVIRKEGKIYSQLNNRSSFEYIKDNEYLITTDRYSKAGDVKSYFWQDLWAARHVFEVRPNMHYDIGSRVDGFITHLLSYKQDVTLIDIRPLDVEIKGLDFIRADATNLEGIEDNSIESLSSLCALEHFGLGRYGDPIDPEACFKCFDAIQRKVKLGGYVYISVPIGKEHLEFNAHRIFKAGTISDAFDKMNLVEFSSCCRNHYEKNIDIHKYDDWTEQGGDRFGLFLFRKTHRT